MTETPVPAPGTAETVNINPPAGIPHVRILAGVTIAVLTGFGVVTLLVLAGAAGNGIDAATKGALIQTWATLAVASVSFWLGSSVSAKGRSAAQ